MDRDLLELASQLARGGEAFALAVVVSRQAPISARVGDAALVTRDGQFHGWVGGSCTRPTVIAEAKKALLDGHPRLLALGPNPDTLARPGVLVFPMTCHSGGSVEIHIQPVLPRARLLIYGMTPTARALSRLAQAMGYDVHACDETAEASDFPGATTVTTDAALLHVERGSAALYAVVATHGDWDERAVMAALAHEPDYLGVVASPKRFASIRAFIAGELPRQSFDKVRNPAGLDIGAKSAEEIALSILAEVVKEQRASASVVDRTAIPSPAHAASSSGAVAAGAPRKFRLTQAASAEALDPVCGMSVRIEGATFRATHRGQDFFFCCGSCRDRFSAAPERYLAAGASP
jgi:xanthine dehydrogenase accessory factor